MFFKDRYDAGRKLANELIKFKNKNAVIVALPRGGVIIGFEVSKLLKAPLDVIVARKIGAPFYPELGIGAIAPHGIKILDETLIKSLNVSEKALEKIIEQETIEMKRRSELYRRNATLADLAGKTVIIVDDGLATGVTARASIMSIKEMFPEKIILAVPVSPPDTAEEFRKEVDEVICLNEPHEFYAVGAFYEDFRQISDDEVIHLLKKAKEFVNPD